MNRAFFAARCAVAVVALYAIAKHPYNYYVLTRWAVFLVCCWGLWQSRTRLWASFAPAYFGLALLFNPILPFHFQRATWQVFDALAGVVLLVSLAIDRPSLRTP